jgi:hypothetical protein
MPLHYPPRSKIRLRRSGGQEVEKESGDSVGDFVSLYALHNWIPASAGMAEESVRLRRTEGLGGVFYLHFDQRKGVQRGKAPLPRVWGCPPTLLFSPQEWGPGG